MNLFKIAGAILIMLCGAFGARSVNRTAEGVLSQYEGFEALIRFARIQIECFGLPCEEIFLRCDSAQLRSCGYMSGATPLNFHELLAGCEIKERELEDIVSGFASEFGAGYREEELRLCDYYLSLLREKRKKLSDELIKKKKVNTTLWVSSALGAVILLF